MNKVMAPLTPDTPNAIAINCHLTLPSDTVIEKRLHIIGSQNNGLVLDCNGATLDPRGTRNENKDMIEVRSQILSGSAPFNANPPHNITIKNCTVFGGVRIYGLGKNGQANNVRLSSQLPQHTKHAQSTAPSAIHLTNMTFYGTGRNPLYFAPGVSASSVTHSRFKGYSKSVALYLGAESHGNQIIHNRFELNTRHRELIAVDGSAYNTIEHNVFMNYRHGGIFLYRNCGEGAASRHQTPSHNNIRFNWFKAGWSFFQRPAIWLGSRQGDSRFCNEDRHLSYGSAKDDNDHAQYNHVKFNHFVDMNPAKAIRNDDQHNLIEKNMRISQHDFQFSHEQSND